VVHPSCESIAIADAETTLPKPHDHPQDPERCPRRPREPEIAASRRQQLARHFGEPDRAPMEHMHEAMRANSMPSTPNYLKTSLSPVGDFKTALARE